MSAFKPQAHAFAHLKGLPWPVCKTCGLVRLRNPLTDWCVKNGCNSDEHPGYRSAVATLGRPTVSP